VRISFLGGGNMANALIGGLLKRHYSAAAIQVVEPFEEARTRLTDHFGVRCTDHVDAASQACDFWVLAVKPQQMRAALAPLSGRLSSQVVISIAAGLRLDALSRWLGGHRKVVRCMPNTPALIGLGITGLVALPEVERDERHEAEKILEAVGQTLWFDDEAKLDAVTAVSGSGPAYVFYFIEALIQAGAELGLNPEDARRLALATFTGASHLAVDSGEDAAVLRARVTSKGGTTEAALQVMESAGVKDAIRRAAAAACARGMELGDELGGKPGDKLGSDAGDA